MTVNKTDHLLSFWIYDNLEVISISHAKDSILIYKRIFCTAFLTVYSFTSFADTIKQLENIALKQSVELKQLTAKASAFNERAIAKAQLADPVLELSVMNLPTDSFRFNQENMTQFKVGIKQLFPKGDSLKFTYEIERFKAKQKGSSKKLKRLEILQNVRSIWAERYYWRQIRWLLLKKQATYKQLVSVTQSMYENHKTPQTDVLSAKTELAKVQTEIVGANRAYEMTTKKLARWVGHDNAARSYPSFWPSYRKLPMLAIQIANIKKHPLIRRAQDRVSGEMAKSNLAKEGFKPQFTLGVSYGHRADMASGTRRADFLSLGINIVLPTNIEQRQNKNYLASISDLSAAVYQKQSDLKQLKQVLETTYIQWQSYKDKAHIYRQEVIPNAKNQIDATVIAYQNAKRNFSALAKSQNMFYQLQMKLEQFRFMQVQQKIHLLYLNGR